MSTNIGDAGGPGDKATSTQAGPQLWEEAVLTVAQSNFYGLSICSIKLPCLLSLPFQPQGWRIEWFAFPWDHLFVSTFYSMPSLLRAGSHTSFARGLWNTCLSFLMHLQLVSSCPDGELTHFLSFTLHAHGSGGFSSALILRSLSPGSMTGTVGAFPWSPHTPLFSRGPHSHCTLGAIHLLNPPIYVMTGVHWTHITVWVSEHLTCAGYTFVFSIHYLHILGSCLFLFIQTYRDFCIL